jgi:hypothetical protein
MEKAAFYNTVDYAFKIGYYYIIAIIDILKEI